jgi:hypothetical protein
MSGIAGIVAGQSSRVCHDGVAKVVALASALALLLGTLHGQVMRGPTTPVCRVGQPCEAPAAGLRLSFTRAGKTATVLTDAKGFYRLRLAAGAYTVRTNQRPFGTSPDPDRVRVVARQSRRVDFHVDTGIR